MTYSYDTHFDRDSIRRQFRLSIGLIVAMALATFILGLSLPVDNGRHAQRLTTAGEMMGRLVSIDQ
jgi:hypothetical protein